MSTLWAGRFASLPDKLMRRFADSIWFDQRLWEFDINGSAAYAKALALAGVIDEDERDVLLAGLDQVRAEFVDNRFEVQPRDEDIHTAVERRLTELVGPVAGRLHTGRSRNDQIATDMRLYVRNCVSEQRRLLIRLQHTIVNRARQHLDALMPGYTHLQPAQPVLFSHWLMSFFWMFQRDRERLDDLSRRVDVLPLGSGALSGNPVGIDQEFLANELGFHSIAQNSMDAVSDRDYLVEYLGWASLLQAHLSRLAEDLIIYASREFGFVEISEAYSTGSSLMPQKKNPDSLELIRGKTGRVIGDLVTLLTVIKGLPSTYNKDIQEDKEAVFDAVDTLFLTLPIIQGIVENLSIDEERMRAALVDDMLATELADYLVSKGIPFREAHHHVGKVVRLAIQKGIGLRSLPLSDYTSVCDAFTPDVENWLDFERAVGRRISTGGTARKCVVEQITAAETLLAVE